MGRARRNPKWSLDGITVETEQDGRGKWSYRTYVTGDATEIDEGDSYPDEDAAVRDAIEQAEDSGDYHWLRKGHGLAPAPRASAYGEALWWGPGDTFQSVEAVTVSDDRGCVQFWQWIDADDQGGSGMGHWSKATVCPDPSVQSHRLRVDVARSIYDNVGGDEEILDQKDFAETFGGTIPDDASAPNPSSLEVIYDGRRRGRDMIYIEPWNTWGEKAYGLSPKDDDYTFRAQGRSVAVGQRVDVVLSDETYNRLVRQRDLRASRRLRR